MGVSVVRDGSGHRLDGDGPITDLANHFLAHLQTCGFSASTVPGYAYDLLCLSRFLAERGIGLDAVVATDLFDWLAWQSRPQPTSGKVVRLDALRGAATATINRRVAAARGFFEYAVIVGARQDSPVPAPRRSTGLRVRQGLLGHVKPRRERSGGRLVRQPSRLPESLDIAEIAAFVADLNTHRDRAMVLAMFQGGLRAAEVRRLRLPDVDLGLRRLRVVGKGDRERIVPVDRVFFVGLNAYLRHERPTGLATDACFVVLRGPTQGQPLSEAGMRRIFRTHRARSGSTRVSPPAAAHLRHRAWPLPGSTCSSSKSSWAMRTHRPRRGMCICPPTRWLPSTPTPGRRRRDRPRRCQTGPRHGPARGLRRVR